MRTMTRNVLCCALTVGVIFTASICCQKARAQGTTIVVGDGSGDQQNQIALQDTFNDNEVAWLWTEYSEDPNNTRMMEVNRRLELRTSAAAVDAFAGFVGNAWRLDPRYDFAMKVDFHYDLYTLEEEGWIGIGLTPSAENPRNQRIEFGAKCVNRFRSFSYEQANGYATRSAYSERSVEDGTLYISYDSESDTVYLSAWGYGLNTAWGAYSDLIKGTWGGRPVYVYLGGRSAGLAITSGHAYLDNMVIDFGKIIEASLRPVYRFWSPVNEAHFFTISEFEKDELVDEYRDVWRLQGTAFRAFPDASDPNCLPVHRFWSDKTKSHLYTLKQSEINKLIDRYPFVWTHEGVAFYAYPEGKQPSWARPVYRFWSAPKGAHLYTMSESEAEELRDNPNTWFEEDIAWYAVP